MGISASQGKLLFMTARISNNEFQQQSIAFSKQRMADRASGVNERYNNALSATKYQILTGFNGAIANYEDLTYNMLTSYNSTSSGRQYIAKDNKGKILVPNKIAKAFKDNNGDFNKFLEAMGYTQADVNVEDTKETDEAIHNAWDKYLVSVGETINNIGDLDMHIIGFGWTQGYPTYTTATGTANGNTTNLYRDNKGYYTERATVSAFTVAHDDGTTETVVGYQTQEQIDQKVNNFHKLNNITYNPETKNFTYDGKDYQVLYVNPKNEKISENKNDYLNLKGTTYTSDDGIEYNVKSSVHALNYSGTTKAQRELYDYACAITEAKANGGTKDLTNDPAMVNYYRNIYNEMLSCGYTTLAEMDKTNNGDVTATEANTSPTSETNFKDSKWFVNQLKTGKLTIAYFSTASKSFVATTIDDDEAIVEKEDKSKIAQAEQEYNTQMDKIEHDEKMFDMELNRLEAEHQALTTELDSINKVIQNNIKGSFGTFKTSA